eukprot:scaffold86624_cov32-Tisochrysis_lutea.AAC.1
MATKFILSSSRPSTRPKSTTYRRHYRNYTRKSEPKPAPRDGRIGRFPGRDPERVSPMQATSNGRSHQRILGLCLCPALDNIFETIHYITDEPTCTTDQR